MPVGGNLCSWLFFFLVNYLELNKSSKALQLVLFKVSFLVINREYLGK